MNYATYHLSAKDNGEERFRLHHMPDIFRQDAFHTVHLHNHSFYTVIWFQNGNGHHYVDFEEYEVVPGSVFFISPEQLHTFDSVQNQTGWVLEFSEDFLQDESSSESLFLKYDVFNSYDSPPFRILDDYSWHTLQSIIDAIIHEMGQESAFAHHDYLAMLVKLFLITVQRNGVTSGDAHMLSTTSQSDRTFVKFRQLLEKNYRKVHTVSEYARMLGVSTKTLTNCSFDSSHKTPLQLINARLALEAKRLLRFTDMSSKEVAYHIGFEDPSYFVKFFKRQTSLSPLEFREVTAPQ